MIKNYVSTNPIPFVGRTTEIADITARLIDPACRLLTVIGLGGSGKTRLAIEAARIVAPHFAHGVVFVGLQPLTRSDLLATAIAQAVGMTPYSEGDLHQQLLDYLQEKTLLLILDNFEHVLEGAALVSTMLAAAPGVKVVATSRETLNVWEEWLYPLKGMATPPSVYATGLEATRRFSCLHPMRGGYSRILIRRTTRVRDSDLCNDRRAAAGDRAGGLMAARIKHHPHCAGNAAQSRFSFDHNA